MIKNSRFLITLVLTVMLLAGCGGGGRVGEPRSETQSVELGDGGLVQAVISFGAGELQISSGAAKLLEASFNYNVDKLKPEVVYKGGTLTVTQPESRGLPSLQGISDFQNQWDLRFSDQVPLDLKVEVGGGTSELQLAGLALERLDINQGAGISTIDLTGDWAQDLDVTIESGAAVVTVLLPSQVGVRVEVDRGPTAIESSGLTKNGDVYTNNAYGVSDVTLQIAMNAGVGKISLEVEDTP